MSSKYSKKRIKKKYYIRVSLAVLAVFVAVFVVAFGIKSVTKIFSREPQGEITTSSGETSSQPQEPKKVASATVVNTGDILIHAPVLNGAYNSANNTYDFSGIFTPISSYFKEADLAVANLEVTLGGTESGSYKGYPSFNIPDSIIDAVKDAGIGMLLTANNHSYDTRLFGLKRTVGVLKEKGMDYIGTRQAADEPHFAVKNVNGINIGMACFTYENKCDTPGRKSINGNIMDASANDLLSSFSYENIDAFYSEAEKMISDMKQGGADCVVFYMHWGEEYRTAPNNWQKKIAQKLCDLGVDVIVGGHPHVLQPIEMLNSSDGTRRTVCIYSLGNAVSNQRKEIMTSCPTGHTEDGMLFYYTFDKYSDGSVVLSSVDIVPTWVEKYASGGVYKYKVYPLENADNAIAQLGLSASAAASAKASFNRTAELISSGLTQCQSLLDCEVRFVNAQPIQ